MVGRTLLSYTYVRVRLLECMHAKSRTLLKYSTGIGRCFIEGVECDYNNYDYKNELFLMPLFIPIEGFFLCWRFSTLHSLHYFTSKKQQQTLNKLHVKWKVKTRTVFQYSFQSFRFSKKWYAMHRALTNISPSDIIIPLNKNLVQLTRGLAVDHSSALLMNLTR